MNEAWVRELADKIAIRDVLSRYCRGLDRMDRDMARSVFTADATTRYYGIYEGSGHGFVDWVWDAHAAMERHSHQISNTLIELSGDTAVSESYVTVVLWTRPPRQTELTVRGRYLDRWTRSNGAWRIREREHVVDTQSVDGVPLPTGVSRESARDRTDPSFRLFAGG